MKPDDTVEDCRHCGKAHSALVNVTAEDQVMGYDTVMCFFKQIERKDAILREFAETDPMQEHKNAYGSWYSCPYCTISDDKEGVHLAICLWERVRKLMGVKDDTCKSIQLQPLAPVKILNDVDL